MVSQSDILAARRRLPTLLRLARACAETHRSQKLETMAISPLGNAAGPYMRVDNVDAVLIYEAEKGGWHADILLKEVPRGVAKIFGTPVANPAATRQIAQDWAVTLLAMMMVSEKQPESRKPSFPPVFKYYGFYFPLIPEVMDAVSKAIPELDVTDMPHSLQRLKDVTRHLFGEGEPTKQQMDNLSEDNGRSLMAIFHRAALAGVVRYPPPEAKPPNDAGPIMSVH